MDAAGVSFPEAHLDANAMADLALAGHEILGFDTVMPEYSVQQEAAALGCEVDWGNRDRMPDNKNFSRSRGLIHTATSCGRKSGDCR
jgi:[methyl-Co(III) methanol-specific corrinoid protein]:coenzyme M methyltransferase